MSAWFYLESMIQIKEATKHKNYNSNDVKEAKEIKKYDK